MQKARCFRKSRTQLIFFDCSGTPVCQLDILTASLLGTTIREHQVSMVEDEQVLAWDQVLSRSDKLLLNIAHALIVDFSFLVFHTPFMGLTPAAEGT